MIAVIKVCEVLQDNTGILASIDKVNALNVVAVAPSAEALGETQECGRGQQHRGPICSVGIALIRNGPVMLILAADEPQGGQRKGQAVEFVSELMT